MAEDLKIGSRVLVRDKNLEGSVKFVGTTLFAPGKWIGVELDETKGKNNGTIQGKAYFQCPENHGLMVRQNQLQVIPDTRAQASASAHFVSRIPGPGHSNIPTPSSKRPSSAGKKSSPQSQHSPPKQVKSAKLQPMGSPQVAPRRPVVAEKASPSFESSPVEEESRPVSRVSPSDEVTDLSQRLAILQGKRAEDKTRIKELEKYKAHYQQMIEYKQKWTESQSDIQQQLKAAKKETREHQLAKEKAEEEMRDLSDTVEMATLDKEMAEERCEGLQAEVEALKEQVEELTIDLEIIKQEISEGGVEGAAANAQCKQLEQQNSRLKEALVRLRDLSAQDKVDHQRTIKDLEKSSTELNLVREQKDKLTQELQEADAIIDELKEQVDVALGAEEMVEKLTDTNLELEEKLEAMNETVSDLEALRDLSEEQEELRMEVEHDLREELDMNLNNVRLMERKLEATQETIIDQQQTIEKFRNLVHNLNADLAENRNKGERTGEGEGGGMQSQAAMMSLNVQLKSAIKTQSRTIDFELRKLEALQATEHINLLNSFMPSSFLVSGGDYDALLVLMLLPRMTFKAELVIDQIKQQHKFDDAMGSLSTVAPAMADQLSFVSVLIYKLTTVIMLVNQANRILKECDVQLYRQMGNVRDDLNIHEKALDILIELMKKEQLDESVPLHGIDKAISHFEALLERRLQQEEGSVLGRSAHLLDQTLVVSAGSDVITLQLLRLRGLAPDNSEFVAQMKEMDSFNNDLRQGCRKVRRKIPSADTNRILLYDSGVAGVHSKIIRRQLLLTESFRALHLKASQRAHSLTDGEKLTSGELEEFIRQVVASGTLQEVGSEVTSPQPKEMLRKAMSLSVTVIDKFLSELSEGVYDSPRPKMKVEAPVTLRARAVKAELSDVEGLGFKLEERQQDILQLRKNLKMKAQELSEAHVKIGLLEKKVESIDNEIAQHVGAEKEETKKMKQALENQERQFQQTITILQGDIENLENERMNLEKKLEQTSRKGGVLASDVKLSSKIRTLGGQGTPYGTSPYQSPAASPFASRKGVDVAAADDGTGRVVGEPMEQNPLLLCRVESLNKALGFSMNENFRLKLRIAKAQMNSLAPLKVPRQLLIKKSKSSAHVQGSTGEVAAEGGNQTDQEKTVLKRTTTLIEDLKKMCLPQVIPSQKPHPQSEAHAVGGGSAREQLSNRMSRIFEMQRRANELRNDVGKLLASEHPGGLITTQLASFTAPQFSKALAESSEPSVLAARLHLAPRHEGAGGACNRVVLSPSQFHTLHMTVVS